MSSARRIKMPPQVRPYRKADEDIREVDYQALAHFRYELRKFLSFSEAAARKQKLTPQQHQALLTIKGFSAQKPISMGDLARLLLIRHNTAVELADRMSKLGLIARVADPNDGRRIHLRLTADGEQRLVRLSRIHVQELGAVSGALAGMLRHFRKARSRQ